MKLVRDTYWGYRGLKLPPPQWAAVLFIETITIGTMKKEQKEKKCGHDLAIKTAPVKIIATADDIGVFFCTVCEEEFVVMNFEWRI